MKNTNIKSFAIGFVAIAILLAVGFIFSMTLLNENKKEIKETKKVMTINNPSLEYYNKECGGELRGKYLNDNGEIKEFILPINSTKETLVESKEKSVDIIAANMCTQDGEDCEVKYFAEIFLPQGETIPVSNNCKNNDRTLSEIYTNYYIYSSLFGK